VLVDPNGQEVSKKKVRRPEVGKPCNLSDLTNE
jgi:hypothetical protein